MKIISWNAEKNEKLLRERGVSFEVVAQYIEKNEVLTVIEHPKPDKYPGQQIYMIEIQEYVYLVPFVTTETEILLKTIIPSRKATRENLQRGVQNEKNQT